MFKAIAKLFWKEFLLLGVLCLINDVIIKITQPQLLRKFLLYFRYVTSHLISTSFREKKIFIGISNVFRSNSDVSHSDAVLFASCMVLLNGIGALTINQLFITGYHNGMKVRIAVCSMIYRKVYYIIFLNFSILDKNYEISK